VQRWGGIASKKKLMGEEGATRGAAISRHVVTSSNNNVILKNKERDYRSCCLADIPKKTTGRELSARYRSAGRKLGLHAIDKTVLRRAGEKPIQRDGVFGEGKTDREQTKKNKKKKRTASDPSSIKVKASTNVGAGVCLGPSLRR